MTSRTMNGHMENVSIKHVPFCKNSHSSCCNWTDALQTTDHYNLLKRSTKCISIELFNVAFRWFPYELQTGYEVPGNLDCNFAEFFLQNFSQFVEF